MWSPGLRRSLRALCERFIKRSLAEKASVEFKRQRGGPESPLKPIRSGQVGLGEAARSRSCVCGDLNLGLHGDRGHRAGAPAGRGGGVRPGELRGGRPGPFG